MMRSSDDLLGMAFKKNNPALRDKIATVFDELIDNGTCQQLIEKWGLGATAMSRATINGGK